CLPPEMQPAVDEREEQREQDDRAGSPDPALARRPRCRVPPAEGLPHARSPSACPRRPVGLKTRMITRSENTPTFSHWPPAYVTVSADNRPRTNPPSAAPLTFPMPPRTAAVNAFSPAVKPRVNTVLLLYRPYMSEAAPAS